MSSAATAKALGIGWDLTCQLATDTCRHLVYSDPTHLDGVHVIGMEEHKWSHNRAKNVGGYVYSHCRYHPPPSQFRYPRKINGWGRGLQGRTTPTLGPAPAPCRS